MTRWWAISILLQLVCFNVTIHSSPIESDTATEEVDEPFPIDLQSPMSLMDCNACNGGKDSICQDGTNRPCVQVGNDPNEVRKKPDYDDSSLPPQRSEVDEARVAEMMRLAIEDNVIPSIYYYEEAALGDSEPYYTHQMSDTEESDTIEDEECEP